MTPPAPTPVRDVSRPASAPSPAPRRTPRVLAATAALALLVLAGACSAGNDGTSSDASGSVAEDAPAAASAPARGDMADFDSLSSDAAADGSLASGSDAGGTSEGSGRNGPPVADEIAADGRALIKTGNVALRSDDVPTARFDVGKVVDSRGGEVAEEDTQADEDGEAERVRLVLRVPVDEFDATMTGLKGVADLIDVTTSTEDVSTEVIDNEVRVALQRRSIDRISVLLDSAADLRDIVAIERELSNREADLGSLEKRQKFLADQTAMATITVSIEPPRDENQIVPEEKDDNGFLAGLDDGWTALKNVTTGLLTVGGAVLPFALVLLLLGIPGRLLVRRFAPRTPSPAAAAPPPTA